MGSVGLGEIAEVFVGDMMSNVLILLFGFSLTKQRIARPSIH